MFQDRKDAGHTLAQSLEHYREDNPIVLAIPRGGVEIGYEVARYLDAELSLIVARKLPFPDNPEAGFGAIAEDGSTFLFEHAATYMPDNVIEKIIHKQKEEIQHRIEVLRHGKPLPDIEGRTAILVDDGIAMGSTMRVSIQLCKNKKARTIVVGVPVTGQHTAEDISTLVEELIVLETPPHFRAVAQVYHNWYDVSDEEVLEILDKWNQSRQGGNS